MRSRSELSLVGRHFAAVTGDWPRRVIVCALLVLVVLAGTYSSSHFGTADVFEFQCRGVGTFTAEFPLQTLVWVPKGTNTRVYLASTVLNDSTFSGQTVRANVSYKFSISRDDALLTDIVGKRNFRHRCIRL